jgi:uncharacterized protein YecE (DUF72 family)
VRISIGTSGYSYPAWKGTFYPPKLPANAMLAFYATQFPTVELNNTFYRMPAAEMMRKWACETPASFRFAVKAPRRITHIGRLKDVSDATKELFRIADVLEQQRGPILFQLPPNMKKDLERLKQFLGGLPASRSAFEFRHESWFDDDVIGALRDHNAALCIADAETFTVPTHATADWAYLRLRRTDYDAPALQKWLKTIQSLNATETFVYFKHEDEGTGPAFGKQFVALANAAGLQTEPSQ